MYVSSVPTTSRQATTAAPLARRLIAKSAAQRPKEINVINYSLFNEEEEEEDEVDSAIIQPFAFVCKEFHCTVTCSGLSSCPLGLTSVPYLANKFSSTYIVLWLGLCYFRGAVQNLDCQED